MILYTRTENISLSFWWFLSILWMGKITLFCWRRFSGAKGFLSRNFLPRNVSRTILTLAIKASKCRNLCQSQSEKKLKNFSGKFFLQGGWDYFFLARNWISFRNCEKPRGLLHLLTKAILNVKKEKTLFLKKIFLTSHFCLSIQFSKQGKLWKRMKKIMYGHKILMAAIKPFNIWLIKGALLFLCPKMRKKYNSMHFKSVTRVRVYNCNEYLEMCRLP